MRGKHDVAAIPLPVLDVAHHQVDAPLAVRTGLVEQACHPIRNVGRGRQQMHRNAPHPTAHGQRCVLGQIPIELERRYPQRRARRRGADSGRQLQRLLPGAIAFRDRDVLVLPVRLPHRAGERIAHRRVRMPRDQARLLDDAERDARIDLVVAVGVVQRQFDAARIDHGPLAIGGALDFLINTAQRIDLDLFPASELLEPGTVVGGREQDAACSPPIASRAARFLRIRLQRGRGGKMHDETHVRFVDAHAKRDRRANHAGLPGHEPFLVARADAGIEPGMIGRGLHTAVAECGGQRFGVLAGTDIDDARALQLFADLDQARDLFLPVAHGFHRIEKVGTEETDAHHPQIPPQPGTDLIRHGGCGSGGERQHGRIAQLGQRLGNEEIVRPEIRSPEIDAMRFVDDGQRDRHTLQRA